jgi:uncharacterized protein (DUF302 family)
MGSSAIDGTVCRQEPALMLYLPLRTLIYVDDDDRTRFAVDQPSTIMANFADPELAELGAHLDQQLAGLLDALGIKTSQGCASRG